MFLSLRIALRFHRGLKNNIFISLVSLISITSIIVGISVSIIALNVVHGFKYELSNRILSVIPHGEIEPVVNTSFFNWQSVLAHIRQMSDVIYASPYINFTGVIEYKNKWHVVCLRSIDFTQNMYENQLLSFIEKDAWQRFLTNTKQVILGKGILDDLKVNIGDWITVVVAHDFSAKNKLLAYKKIRLQVAGVLNLNSQLDCDIAIISLSTAQYYCNDSEFIVGISIKVNDIFSANKIVYRIKKVLHDQVCVKSWMNTYGYIYKDIQMIRIIIYLSLILIMGISCFNVIATLILSIKEKNYDIAVIYALGAQNILIRCVFFWYGLIIYIIASFIGTGLGVFVSFNLTSIIMVFDYLFGSSVLSEGVYFIDFLPMKLSKWDILSVLSVTLLLGLLTSWGIAFRTKNIDLSKILK